MENEKSVTRRKLSDENVRTIRKRVARGETNRAVAKDFDIGEAYVGQLSIGRWRRSAGGPFTYRPRGFSPPRVVRAPIWVPDVSAGIAALLDALGPGQGVTLELRPEGPGLRVPAGREDAWWAPLLSDLDARRDDLVLGTFEAVTVRRPEARS
jgi:hypothetical protein